MLTIGRQSVRNCNSWTRRELLRVGSLSALGLSAAPLLTRVSRAADAGNEKSVILLWLWGGPPHLDTFDMKPRAPIEYRGPYQPISTAIPGTQICELLPKLAERTDRYSIIRSMHHTSNDHGIAGTIGLTGSDFGATSLSGQVLAGKRKPTHGSVVSKVLGFRPGMPRFVTMGGRLHQGKRPITGEDAASLGPMFDPFRLDYDPEHGVKIPQLDLIDGVTASGLDSRRDLQLSIDRLADRIERSSSTDKLDQYYQQAFSLLTSKDSRRVFDLDQEPDALRRQYGRFRFGQCCLLSRRLIEAGARFVQVNWSSHVEPVEDGGDGGWDMHDRNFQQFQDRHAWMLDQSASALLDDLDQRGMLDNTIVLAIGEFGRTPKINGKSGRDHWHQCYSGLVAGGGFRSGLVIGQSDRHGEHPIANPVTPADLYTTVLSQIGIGTTELTGAGLAPMGNVIEELV